VTDQQQHKEQSMLLISVSPASDPHMYTSQCNARPRSINAKWYCLVARCLVG